MKGSAGLEGRRHAMDLVPSSRRIAARCSSSGAAVALPPSVPLYFLAPPAFWQGLGAGSLSHSRFGANNPAVAIPGERDGAHQEEGDLELDTKMCVFSRGANDERMTSVCDYSLQNVQSRPARIGDELIDPRFWYWNPGLRRAQNERGGGMPCPGLNLLFRKALRSVNESCSVGTISRSHIRLRYFANQ